MKPSSRKSARRQEIFTIEKANATLPLVRAIARDLAGLSQEVIERRHRLSVLLAGRNPNARDPYREELAQIEQELEKDNQRLQEYVEELRELGVEPTSVPDGVIDFPAMIDGRKVYLCWKLGEPEVRYWHEPGAGFRERRLLGVARDTASA